MATPQPATTRALGIPELVHEILAHLWQGDWTRTAQVSRLWRAHTETLLYSNPGIGRSYDLEEPGRYRSLRGLVEAVERRTELAIRVKALDLVVQDWGPSPESPTAVQLATKLLLLCINTTSLELGGESTLECCFWFLQPGQADQGNLPRAGNASLVAQLVGIAGSYAAQLTELDLETEHSLSAIAPFLARFVHLGALVLVGSSLDQANISQWPTPTFRLSKLDIFFDLFRDYPFTQTEFDWLTTSSRDSLRHLDLPTTTPDIVDSLGRWGHNLRVLSFMRNGSLSEDQDRTEALNELSGAVGLGRLPSLRKFWISIIVADSEWDQREVVEFANQVEVAAGEVNKELGKELVEIDWG